MFADNFWIWFEMMWNKVSETSVRQAINFKLFEYHTLLKPLFLNKILLSQSTTNHLCTSNCQNFSSLLCACLLLFSAVLSFFLFLYFFKTLANQKYILTVWGTKSTMFFFSHLLARYARNIHTPGWEKLFYKRVNSTIKINSSFSNVLR